MKKKNIFTVSASSNLLETNKCWDSPKEWSELIFESYGDLASQLFQDHDKGLIMVLFLEDLVSCHNIDMDKLKENYSQFLEQIRQRASTNSKPIIVCWGRYLNQNVIELVKSENILTKFYQWFSDQLRDLRDDFEHFFLILLDDIFFPYGAKNMFSDRNWYYARCRLSVEGLNVLANALSSVMYRLVKAPSKVLVLDCDNTIWGGVVGEDGISSLVLGQDGLGTAFVDFQKEAVKLVNEGVIIVLASKNNEQDVWDVFDNHTEMFMKREHVVAAKINWHEKAINIEQIAQDLDLNLDSFVFWDDNPLERGKMKKLMPQVITVDVPKSVHEWPKLLRENQWFAKFKTTDEDRKKVDQYKSRAKFTDDIKSATDITSYLSSLKLKPIPLPLDETNVARAEQLCMKTNQFNVSTRRHSAAELILCQKENEDAVFLVRLTDNYGDHGLVSLVCLRMIDEKSVLLDTFLMSCRVLGRHLEAWILDETIKRVKKNGARYLFAEFVDTKRNTVAHDFLHKYGFKQLQSDDLELKKSNLALSSNNGVIYYLDITDIHIPNLEIYTGNK